MNREITIDSTDEEKTGTGFKQMHQYDSLYPEILTWLDLLSVDLERIPYYYREFV